MRRFCVAAAAAAVLMTGMLMAQIPTPTIVKKSPALDALIAPDAVFEKLGEGFEWTEGPVWNTKGGFLLFSDIPNNAINKWEPGKGISEFLKPSGYHGATPFTGPEPGTNGLTFDAQGRLVACQHGDRQVARWENGAWTPLAAKYEGKRLNSPNDLVFHSSGALYFTDPPYGLPKRWDDPAKELPYQGVYRRATDGTVTLLTKELNAPNGLAFSPDEKTLYVAQSDPDEGHLDEVPGQGRRHASVPGTVLLDATPDCQGEEAGAARRLEGRREGESLGDRARRRARHRARRHAPRHALDRRAHGQRRLGR